MICIFLRKNENFSTVNSKYKNIRKSKIVEHSRFLLTELESFEKFAIQIKLWTKNQNNFFDIRQIVSAPVKI